MDDSTLRNTPERGAHNFWWVAVGVGLIAALVAAAFLLPLHFHFRRQESPGKLEHYDGRIDNRGETVDRVKSDLYVRASRALQAGEAPKAEAIYREVIAKYPQDPDGYCALGTTLGFEDRPDAAAAQYEEALRLDARCERALYGLGCVAYGQRQPAVAKDYLERALAVDPNNAQCHRVLGFAEEELGNEPAALEHLERAQALSPGELDDAAKQHLAALKARAGLGAGAPGP